MEFSINAHSVDPGAIAAWVVPVFDGKVLSAAGKALDTRTGGHLETVLALGDLEAKPGSTLWLPRPNGLQAERLLLLACAKPETASDKDYRDAMRGAAKALAAAGLREACFEVLEAAPATRDAGWAAEELVLALLDVGYRFDQTKSKKDEKPLLQRALVRVDETLRATVETGIRQGEALGHAVNLARDLGNLPSNICTPTYLAQTARRIARDFDLTVEILEQKDIEKLGMGSFLSVAKGSVEPMKLIVLQHSKGHKKDQPVVLVGKGITFDSGGISLKPGDSMDEMKYDMMGAASVLATLQAVAALKLPLNVIALVPTCENMPAGNASKPGDVVTTLSGQTVEILNTDAEGRLILCDALTYAERFNPAAVVDVATLTGACVIALGHVATGLFANQDALATELRAAGETSGDRAWPMPLWDDYQEQLKSNFADMANIGGRPAGSVTAACFLSRFTRNYAWAHLDIAGTAWKSGAAKGATGRPVALLTRFLQTRAAVVSATEGDKPASSGKTGNEKKKAAK